jgi:hypothetical protein
MDLLEFLGFRWLVSRLLRFRPRISKDGNVLIATSGWRAQICSFGFGSRKVLVDPSMKTIRIIIRSFWFNSSSTRIEFPWVEQILYEYSDWGVGFWAYQQIDLFTVRLKLSNGEIVTLFRFFGEGDFLNESGWPDWLYWDDFALASMTKGNQERESLMFCDLLGQMIGVPIVNPLP